MAGVDDSELTAVFPPPPPYVRFFTNENVKRAEELDREKDDIPKELTFLFPPENPKGKVYRAFGNIWHTEDKMESLEALGMKQLYKERDNEGGDTSESGQDSVWKIEELKKLTKSLLLNFLEIIGIMTSNPEKFPEKLEDVRIILINIHHLINEYRPHQSRESLIMLVRGQIEHEKKEIEHIEETCRNVERRLVELAEKISEMPLLDKRDGNGGDAGVAGGAAESGVADSGEKACSSAGKFPAISRILHEASLKVHSAADSMDE